jgi:hypothetical protein
VAGLAAASVPGLVALGPRAGARVAALRRPARGGGADDARPVSRDYGGFDLHARIVVLAGERERLERLSRYALRPPIAQARLRVDPEGHVWLTLPASVGRWPHGAQV